MEIVEKTDCYVIEIDSPHLKENKLDIQINEKGVFIFGEMIQLAEKKDSVGRFTGDQKVRQMVSRQFPLLPGADHLGAVVVNNKNKIIITLRKKGAGNL